MQDQQIIIDAPQPGATISSPAEVRGRTSIYPLTGNLLYRVFDAAGALIGSGQIPVAGERGEIGTFTSTISYTSALGGPGRLELVDINQVDGSETASAEVIVTLAPSGSSAAPTGTPIPGIPTLTPLPSPATATAIPQPGGQAITIETPAPGTQVGSPVVITGRTARLPFNGALSYRVSDAAGAELGIGAFGVSGNADGTAQFNASLTFNLPPAGGPIRVELLDRDPATGSVAAGAAIDLVVAVPQQIVIETPAPGTQVGSPVVITGRTARQPFQGNLAYRVLDAAGNRLGEGIFAVEGGPGQPGRFNASLTFNLPPGGGQVRVELTDQDAASGAVAASASINLVVAPPTQAIVIETPAPGTQVGSPVVITGRTVLYPFNGILSYRLVDSTGVQLGVGSFPVSGPPGQAARFNTSITFQLPRASGPIRLDLFDQNQTTGAVAASATINLFFALPTTPTPVAQQIVIETPAPGTQVGSPVVITGRTARYPSGGSLFYRVLDAANNQLGVGSVAIGGTPGQPARFNLSLTFTLPPGGGPIAVELTDRDATTGTTFASALINLTVAAPYPEPRLGP